MLIGTYMPSQSDAVPNSCHSGPAGGTRGLFANASAALMKKAGQTIVNVIGVNPSYDSLDALMAQDQIEAAIYFTFGPAQMGYAGLHGTVSYVHGKPVVGGRLSLWGNADSGLCLSRALSCSLSLSLFLSLSFSVLSLFLSFSFPFSFSVITLARFSLFQFCCRVGAWVCVWGGGSFFLGSHSTFNTHLIAGQFELAMSSWRFQRL